MYRSNIFYALEKQRCGNSHGAGLRRELLAHSSLVNKLTLDDTLDGHNGCVNRLVWNSSGTRLASVSDDYTCVVWSVAGGRYRVESTIDTGHTRNIFGVGFLPGCDDQWLATGAMDHQVRVHVRQGDGASNTR